MTKPKYTFLLPAYKAKYFKEALRSIKEQTYQNFKVLVSDDCSPEDLKSIFDDVCGDDSHFSYRRNEENIGGKSLVAHWNLLVDKCDTEWLIMASDDDTFEPTFLEEFDRLRTKYPEVDMLRARVRSINDKGETLAEDAHFDEHVDHLGFIYQKHFNNALRCIANYAFRTKALKEKGGFVEFPLAWYSDDASVMMMAEHGCANTDQMLFNFRSSDESISSRSLNSKDAYKKAQATILFNRWWNNMLNSIKGELVQNHLAKHELRFAVSCHDTFMYEQFNYMFSNCTFNDFIHLLKMQPKTARLRWLRNYLSAKLKKH